jgi:tight adherence protein C
MVSIIIFLILIGVFITLYIFSAGQFKEYLKPVNTEEYILKPFIPLALLILEIIKYKYASKYDKNLLNKYSEISGKKSAKVNLQIHIANKIVLIFLGLLFIFFICSILALQQTGTTAYKNTVKIDPNETIERPSYGEGDKETQLQAELQSGEAKTVEQFRVPLKEMSPVTEDEKAIAKALDNLTDDFIKGSNKNLMNICEKLILPRNDEKLGNMGIKIVWESGNTELVKSDGTVIQPQYGAGSRKVILQAILSKGVSTNKKKFVLKVLQSETPQNDLQKVLAAKNEIQEQIDEGRIIKNDSSKITLPNKLINLNDLKINWFLPKAKKDNTVTIFLIFGLSILIIIAYAADSDLNKKIRKRRNKLQLDFPDFLNRLSLLVNAGMTVSRAWIKISEDANKKGPLYDEIALTVSEIKSGKSEIIAYEDFALRCKVPEITKLVSIIEQNLKKGSKELVSILKFQASDCWQMRKNVAKRLGEEASTKMLLPLMLMFAAIILIVATPAIMAMQGF